MNDPATSVPAYVRHGEKVLWIGKPTLLVLISNAFGFAVFLLFAGIFSFGNAAQDGPPFASFLPVLALSVFALIITLNALRLRRTEYVITDQGIYTRSGIIGQSVIQTTYDKITDIALRQDVLGRIFGYSTLQVNTAGSNTAPVQMSGLQRALDVKQRVEHNRDVFLQRGRTTTPKPAWQSLPANLPRFTLDRDIALLTCPTTKRAFKRPRSDLGTKVACPHCAKKHVAKETSRGSPA